MSTPRLIQSETECIYIPPDSVERFLPPSIVHDNVLLDQGIAMGGLSKWGPTYRLERRRFPHHLMLYTLAGTGLVTIGNAAAVELLPGDVFLAPTPSAYSYRTAGKFWETAWLHLAATPHWAALFRLHAQVRPFLCADMLTRVMQCYIDEAGMRGADSVLALHHYAKLMAIYIQRELESANPREAQQTNRLKVLLESIRGNLADDWTIERMSRMAGTSRAQFHRLVPRLMGRSPLQMVHAMRMERATELLVYTRHDLATIAEEIGYGSAFSFSKAFKHHFKMSPSQFRRKSV